MRKQRSITDKGILRVARRLRVVAKTAGAPVFQGRPWPGWWQGYYTGLFCLSHRWGWNHLCPLVSACGVRLHWDQWCDLRWGFTRPSWWCMGGFGTYEQAARATRARQQTLRAFADWLEVEHARAT